MYVGALRGHISALNKTDVCSHVPKFNAQKTLLKVKMRKYMCERKCLHHKRGSVRRSQLTLIVRTGGELHRGRRKRRGGTN